MTLESDSSPRLRKTTVAARRRTESTGSNRSNKKIQKALDPQKQLLSIRVKSRPSDKLHSKPVKAESKLLDYLSITTTLNYSGPTGTVSDYFIKSTLSVNA